MTNPITAIQNWFTPTAVEADVIVFIAKVKAGITTAKADLQAVLNWLDANAGTIATDITAVLGIAVKLGAAGNPQLAALVAAANVAVGALNTYAASRAGGATQAQAAVDGYKAVTQAQMLHAQVGQALASAQYAPVAPASLADLADAPVTVQIVVPKP